MNPDDQIVLAVMDLSTAYLAESSLALIAQPGETEAEEALRVARSRIYREVYEDLSELLP